MTTRYTIALTFYSILFLGLLLFILMWTLGMKKDAEFTLGHCFICSFVILNISFLIALPYVKKLKKVFAILNLVMLCVSFVFTLCFVVPMDFALGTVTFLITYIASTLVLLIENTKQISFHNR